MLHVGNRQLDWGLHRPELRDPPVDHVPRGMHLPLNMRKIQKGRDPHQPLTFVDGVQPCARMRLSLRMLGTGSSGSLASLHAALWWAVLPAMPTQPC